MSVGFSGQFHKLTDGGSIPPPATMKLDVDICWLAFCRLRFERAIKQSVYYNLLKGIKLN